MSTRFISNNSQNNTDIVSKLYPSRLSSPWVRNPSWPIISASIGSQRVVGLYAVYPNEDNFIALNCQGPYTVNYGDGTVTDYNGVQANYIFNYSSANLVGTDAPVTFTASTDLVNRTAHGYTNGMLVQFYNIVTTTGIVEAQYYYVINATANTFQISSIAGGTAINLVGDGSATLLPYRIATVTITPQSGQFISLVNLCLKHNQAGLVNNYSTGWLDIVIASSDLSSLTIGSSNVNVRHLRLQQVRIIELGFITSFINLFANCTALQSVEISASTFAVNTTNGMFQNCYSLTTVPLFDTGTVQNMGSMFQGCFNLTTIPLLNTAAAISMASMFQNCYSLRSVPLFNTTNTTSLGAMFNSCFGLTEVPLFNTVNVTDMGAMFQGCSSLTIVPLFNTDSVQNMTSMFANCWSLPAVPLFNTASVQTMNSMFANCVSLETVRLFNTINVVNMSNMFQGCVDLKSVPLFNTINVVNMSSMFLGCLNLATVPLFNTVTVFNFSSMFSGCSNLQSVPALITTAVATSANFTTMFASCPSLSRIQARNFRFTFSVANCKLSATALNEIYTNLPTVTSQTITVTGNYGTATDNPAIATAKGWTVTG